MLGRGLRLKLVGPKARSCEVRDGRAKPGGGSLAVGSGGGRARGICCLKVTLGPSDIYGRGAGRPSTHSRPPFPHRTAFATRLPPRPVPCRSAASGWGTGVCAPAREACRKWVFGTASLLGAPRQISPPPTISTKPSVVTLAAGVLPGGVISCCGLLDPRWLLQLF